MLTFTESTSKPTNQYKNWLFGQNEEKNMQGQGGNRRSQKRMTPINISKSPVRTGDFANGQIEMDKPFSPGIHIKKDGLRRTASPFEIYNYERKPVVINQVMESSESPLKFDRTLTSPFQNDKYPSNSTILKSQ